MYNLLSLSYDAVWAEVLITFPREADALRVSLETRNHHTITPFLLKLSLPLLIIHFFSKYIRSSAYLESDRFQSNSLTHETFSLFRPYLRCIWIYLNVIYGFSPRIW